MRRSLYPCAAPFRRIRCTLIERLYLSKRSPLIAAAMSTNFLTSRSKQEARPGRQSKTEAHLRSWLDTYDAMTEKERGEAAALAWMPPREVVKALLDPKLLQRDRIEVVIVAYGATHPGHTPSWDELGRILGIAYVNARLYGRQLLDLGRAEMRDGKFCLKPAGYSHPIIRARFPSIYRALYIQK